MNQPLGLIPHRGQQFRMGMAEVAHGDSSQQIQILPSVRIEEGTSRG